MEKNLKSSQTRARQYWFADGLGEISGAAICLLLAVYFCIQQLLPSSQGSFPLIFLAVFLAAFGIRRLMLWYRQRSTYPRTGFIESKTGLEDRRLLGISIGFTVLLLGFMLFTILRGIQTGTWFPAISGIIFAFVFGLAGYRTKLTRFFFLGAFCLVLGGILALSGLGDLWGAAVLSLITSLVLFAYGTVTRSFYLRQTKTLEEQSNER